MMPKKPKNVSQHVLPTSATLLGFCFLVLCSIKAMGIEDTTLIDEAAAIGIIIFLIPCVFSYAAMRDPMKGVAYETIADIAFLIGLGLIALLTVLVYAIIH